MKRSIRSVLGLMGLALSFNSYASNNLNAGDYSGTGNWKSSSGQSGEYAVQANFSFHDQDLYIVQNLNFGERALDLSFVIHPLNETFYEVLNGESNEVVGNGYCWDLEQVKICHSDSTIGDENVEGTIKIASDYIHRFGSKYNKLTGERVIWKDKLERQPEEN